MVGGGEGAFIGAVHRLAARMDDHFQLVAGALSSTPERAAASAAALGLAPDRGYADFATMARAEAARPDGIEVVAIVTPNHTHLAIAKAFLEAGIHVICDTPSAGALDEARALADCVAASGRLFIVTYNYSGYPMVRQARQLAAGGALGALRLVEVEYVQGWLSQPIERQGSKQAAWRTDPAQAAPAVLWATSGSTPITSPPMSAARSPTRCWLSSRASHPVVSSTTTPRC
jgi:predicted dehydrogenase